MPAGYAFLSIDLGQLTLGISIAHDTTGDANALVVGLDSLVVRKHSSGFDPPAVRADEVFRMSTPWETGFQGRMALHHLALGHVLPFEPFGSPVGEVFGDEFDFEIVDRSDVREDDFEDFRRERSKHCGNR